MLSWRSISAITNVWKLHKSDLWKEQTKGGNAVERLL